MRLRDRLFSHASYQIINNIVVLLIGVVGSVYYARFLGPEEFGRFNFILWFLGICGLFSSLGFNGTLSRHIALCRGRQDDAAAGRILGTCLVAELVLSLLLTVGCFAGREVIVGFFADPVLAESFVVLILSFIPSAAATVFRYTLIGLQRVKVIAGYEITINLLTLIGNAALLWSGFGLYGVFVFSLVMALVRCVSLLGLLRRDLPVRMWGMANRDEWPELWRYAGHLTVIVIADQVIWERSEIFFLQQFSTTDQIAHYSLAFGWGMRVVGFLPGVLGGFLIPVMAQLQGGGEEQRIEKVFFYVTRYAALLLIPITFGMLAISDSFIEVLYGTAYGAVPMLMIPIFLSKGFISLFTAASAVLFASGRQSFIVRWGLVLALLNLVLDYFLIRSYGALGAAWATSVVHALAGLVTLVYIVRWLNYRVPWRFLWMLAAICLTLFVPTRMITQTLPGVSGLTVAIVANACLYLLAVRVTGVFEAQDREILQHLANRAPTWLRPLFVSYFRL